MTRLTMDRALSEILIQNINPVMLIIVIMMVNTMMKAADQLKAISKRDTRKMATNEMARLDSISLQEVRYCSKNT